MSTGVSGVMRVGEESDVMVWYGLGHHVLGSSSTTTTSSAMAPHKLVPSRAEKVLVN